MKDIIEHCAINVIQMQQFEFECAMCGVLSSSNKAVPFYCEPVREGESKGGYASVCDGCYEEWESTLGTNPGEQNE